MITLPRTVRVWAYGKPADLRKGYNGLVGIVETTLRRDVLGGDLFLFVNVRRTICKVLLWDGTGLCIFMKRIERGRFADVWRAAKDGVLQLTSSELTLFIEGCALLGKTQLSPTEILRKQLAASDRM
jgi:transposase